MPLGCQWWHRGHSHARRSSRPPDSPTACPDLDCKGRILKDLSSEDSTFAPSKLGLFEKFSSQRVEDAFLADWTRRDDARVSSGQEFHRVLLGPLHRAPRFMQSPIFLELATQRQHVEIVPRARADCLRLHRRHGPLRLWLWSLQPIGGGPPKASSVRGNQTKISRKTRSSKCVGGEGTTSGPHSPQTLS